MRTDTGKGDTERRHALIVRHERGGRGKTGRTLMIRGIGRVIRWTALAAAIGAAAACSNGPKGTKGFGPADTGPKVPAPAPASPTANAPSAGATNAQPLPLPATGSAPIASEHGTKSASLVCDVLDVQRSSGGELLVRWRIGRPQREAATGTAGTAEGAAPVALQWNWKDVHVIDPADHKRYDGLRESNGEWMAQGEPGRYEPGEQHVMWMKFPAPAAGAGKITFTFPGFPPFENLPVS
jgi:hypothetical protein